MKGKTMHLSPSSDVSSVESPGNTLANQEIHLRAKENSVFCLRPDWTNKLISKIFRRGQERSLPNSGSIDRIHTKAVGLSRAGPDGEKAQRHLFLLMFWRCLWPHAFGQAFSLIKCRAITERPPVSASWVPSAPSCSEEVSLQRSVTSLVCAIWQDPTKGVIHKQY